MTDLQIRHQFESVGEESMFLARSDMLKLERGPIPYESQPLRDTFNEVYGPETTASRPEKGGWFAVQCAARSRDEHLLVNMEYPPVHVYITLSGIKRAIQNWPGQLVQ